MLRLPLVMHPGANRRTPLQHTKSKAVRHRLQISSVNFPILLTNNQGPDATLPLHDQQGAIEGMPDGSLPWQACNQMDHLVYRGVGQGAEGWVNCIIHTTTMWEGQVGNDPPLPNQDVIQMIDTGEVWCQRRGQACR